MKKIILSFVIFASCFGLNLALAEGGLAPAKVAGISTQEDVVKNTLPTIIKFVIGIVGTLAFLSFLYSGAMMVIYGENEGDVEKYKTNLKWSIVGLAVAGLAFVIVTGVLALFDSGGTGAGNSNAGTSATQSQGDETMDLVQGLDNDVKSAESKNWDDMTSEEIDAWSAK